MVHHIGHLAHVMPEKSLVLRLGTMIVSRSQISDTFYKPP